MVLYLEVIGSVEKKTCGDASKYGYTIRQHIMHVHIFVEQAKATEI